MKQTIETNQLDFKCVFSFRVIMNGVKFKPHISSNKAQEDAQHIWSMLDELSVSDPAAYKAFITKTLEEGKSMHKSSSKIERWKLLSARCYGQTEILLFNVICKDNVDFDLNAEKIPIKSSWEYVTVNGFKIYTIFIQSAFAKSVSNDNLAMRELYSYFCWRLREIQNIHINVELFEESQPSDFDSSVIAELDKEFRSTFSKQSAQMADIENEKREIILPFHEQHNENKDESLLQSVDERTNSRNFVEEIGASNGISLPEPAFTFQTDENFVIYDIELPDLKSLTSYDLVMTKTGIMFEIPGAYRLEHDHLLSVNDSMVSAKFVRKSKRLKIKISRSR
ncbi:uncharacterized protein LOC142337172 [Convolutriloba macropyga]|uniref:uncharacterized protein LOC142337172 n=1 Tax=Convolutriloba macropyga TaxID=536237 RepID=UPI003F527EA4